MNVGEREKNLIGRLAGAEERRKVAGEPVRYFETICDTCGASVRADTIASLAVMTHLWYIAEHGQGDLLQDGCPTHAHVCDYVLENLGGRQPSKCLCGKYEPRP